MAKQRVTIKALETLETIDESKVYIIRRGKLCEIVFDAKPSYHVIGSSVTVLETIDESLVFGIPDRDYEPHGQGKVSFYGWGKRKQSDVDIDATNRAFKRPTKLDID